VKSQNPWRDARGRVLALASTKKEWYSIKNAAAPDARSQVHIYDEIGFMGKTAHDFIQDLDGIEGPIDLHLNSPGGEVFDGVAIYNTLLAREDVDVYVDGIAASIASVIAMAGDRVFIAPTAQFMVHNAFAMACGDATDLREMANQLERNTANIASIYAARSGQTAEHWLGLMEKESWFTGQEAVDAGLADSVIPMKTAVARYDMALPPKVGKMAAALAGGADKAQPVQDAAHHPYHGHFDIHHEPMTGTHSHNHAEFGFGDGDDGIHAHSHTHNNDGSHGHEHMSHSHSHGRDEHHEHAHAAGHEHYDNADHTHTHHAYDPDHDGDDDSTAAGDTDHDYVLPDGSPGPKASAVPDNAGPTSPQSGVIMSSGSETSLPTTQLFNEADAAAFVSALRG
jgi:ATP-dependent protease ClpP protease subunit